MIYIYTLVIALLLTVNSWAQAPQKMSYQAVIRNTSNALVTSTPVGMKISILQGSSTGSFVYTETQTPSTNSNGLVSIEIGNGTVVTGTFTAINWANGPYFIKTETDPTGGTAYTIVGTSELFSVPYALHAKTAEGITGGITETDPVFVASPANGITTTNITNWNNKLDTEVDGSVTNEIQTLRISNDTIYLSNGGFAKLPAGFDGNYNSLTNKPTAVSSFSNDAGYLTSFTEVDGSITNELQTLSISNDTIYLSNGGFAKLPATNAWSLNGNAGTVNGTNFIGTTDNVPLNFKVNNQKAGRVEAGSNLFFGYEAGLNYTSGADNTAIGYKALAATNARTGNTAIGSWALSSNTSDRNTAIGFGTMQNNVSGQWNTAVGSSALITNNSGSHNTAIGGTALQGNISAAGNAALGYGALLDHQSGDANTSVGMYALKGNLNGSNNIGLGFESGYNNVSGTGNIFIGYRAGYNETGSNKLYIANSNTTTPLIYGDFTTGKIGLGTITPTYKLELIGGDASFNGVRVGQGNGNISTNTAAGLNVLNSNSTGYSNAAFGDQVLFANTTGFNNSSFGSVSLKNNTIGSNNSAFGKNALFANTIGTHNTAVGSGAMYINTTGEYNVALGVNALNGNTTGGENTATGVQALFSNTTGNRQTAYGKYALLFNTTGNNNTAIGMDAGRQNVNGSNNVFLGYQAGYNETGSNKLYIANSSTTTPLIYGDFATGRVGFGTTNPGGVVDIAGGFIRVQSSDIVPIGNVDGLEMGFFTSGGYAFLQGYNRGSGTFLPIEFSGSTVGFRANGTTAMKIISSGNVGIGTTSPTAKLEVQGAVKIVDGTQAAGKVLTSDATGLATWQSLTTYSAGNGISITGNMIAVKEAFYLGQDTLGGIVYYIYKGSDGHQHGLIVSKTETVTIWGANGTNNATKTSDGAYNTSFMPLGDARAWVESFGAGWYLPSIDELAILWNNRFHVNNSTASGLTQLKIMGNYWSSTEPENDIDYSIFFYFFHGYANGGTKNSALNARAIKAF